MLPALIDGQFTSLFSDQRFCAVLPSPAKNSRQILHPSHLGLTYCAPDPLPNQHTKGPANGTRVNGWGASSPKKAMLAISNTADRHAGERETLESAATAKAKITN